MSVSLSKASVARLSARPSSTCAGARARSVVPKSRALRAGRTQDAAFQAGFAQMAGHEAQRGVRGTIRVVCKASQVQPASSKGKILVLGGTGFVGSYVCKEALKQGYDVVALSRRGAPSEGSAALAGVNWRTADLVADPGAAAEVMSEGGFVGVVHAVGMLLDGPANALASGSGSVPGPGTTYDQITRETAIAAADGVAALSSESESPLPMVFVSAAEAGWTVDPPMPDWLARYLAAKRAVESALLEDYGPRGALRPVIPRCSLIWTPDRPAAVPPVAAFYLGHALRIPGVDRPVRVETVAAAAVSAIGDARVTGFMNWERMEQVAGPLP